MKRKKSSLDIHMCNTTSGICSNNATSFHRYIYTILHGKKNKQVIPFLSELRNMSLFS